MAFDMQDLLARIKDLPEDAKNAVLDAVSKVKSVGDLGDVLREHGIDLDPSQLQGLFDNLKDNAGNLVDTVKAKASDVVDRDRDGKVDLVQKAKGALDADKDGDVDLDDARSAVDADHDGKVDLIEKVKGKLDKDGDGAIDVVDDVKDKISGLFHKKDDEK